MGEALTLPFVQGSATSEQAARKMSKRGEKVERDRRAILDLLRKKGPMTDAEMQAGLSMGGNTQRPRRGELAKMKLIAHTGERRSGSAVWGLV